MGELLLREVSVGHAERQSHSLDTTSDTIAMVESCISLGRLRPPDAQLRLLATKAAHRVLIIGNPGERLWKKIE